MKPSRSDEAGSDEAEKSLRRMVFWSSTWHRVLAEHIARKTSAHTSCHTCKLIYRPRSATSRTLYRVKL
eukprot:351758-Chlamydomonas_euryale.AAC.2